MNSKDGKWRLVERSPSVAEYTELVEAVGWRRREPAAIAIALARSDYALCAESGDRMIGCGRVIGDGGLHFYVTDMLVHPEFQGRGIGSAILKELCRFLSALPYENTLASVLPTKGLRQFYESQGFVAQKDHSPAMLQWINEHKN